MKKFGILPQRKLHFVQDPEFQRKSNKQVGLLICLVAYLVAGIMVWLVYDAVSVLHPIAVVLILDILATLVIFLFYMKFIS